MILAIIIIGSLAYFGDFGPKEPENLKLVDLTQEEQSRILEESSEKN